MTTDTSYQLESAAIAARQELVAWLTQTFDTAFSVATRSESGEWHYIAVDQVLDTTLEPIDDALSAICDEVVTRRSPIVSLVDFDRHAVVIPLMGGVPEAQLAIGMVDDASPKLLERMAELWVTAAYSKHQGERFQAENDYFAEQLSEGLEELTFLRSMVEYLEVSDRSNDLLALADLTLPPLNETVKAECLSLLMTPEGIDPLDAIPTACFGPRPLADSAQMQIVQRYGGSAMSQPVVKNRLTGVPESAELHGVREFILVPLASRNRQMGWLLAVNRHWPDAKQPEFEWPLSHQEFGSSEATLLSTTASILATHASNLDLFREKEQILVNVVRSLVSAVDAKDEYTCGHSERVALFGKILAEQAGYDEEQCQRLYLTGLLHDVGKIGVSDAVLKKNGKLSDDEFAEIKRHPDEGWSILQDLKQLQYVLPGVLYHHERVDGGGYPDALVGDEIPLDGRLLAIVDAYDAMTSDRPYRAGMPPERAQQILRSGAGTQWDATLVEHFFQALERIEAVRMNYQLRERPARQPQSCD